MVYTNSSTPFIFGSQPQKCSCCQGCHRRERSNRINSKIDKNNRQTTSNEYLTLSKIMLFAFAMMIIIQPEFLQAMQLSEHNGLNKTLHQGSEHLHHHGKKGYHSHKHHKQLLQTNTRSDNDDGIEDDDDDDTVSIEEVDPNAMNSTAQTNSSQNNSANTQNNNTAIDDSRLSKNGSFLHLAKIKNFGVAIGDALSDSMIYLKNLLPTPESKDGEEKEKQYKDFNQFKVIPGAGSKAKLNTKQMSEFSVKGMQYYSMSNGELMGVIFLIMFGLCCLCICVVVCIAICRQQSLR